MWTLLLTLADLNPFFITLLSSCQLPSSASFSLLEKSMRVCVCVKVCVLESDVNVNREIVEIRGRFNGITAISERRREEGEREGGISEASG